MPEFNNELQFEYHFVNCFLYYVPSQWRFARSDLRSAAWVLPNWKDRFHPPLLLQTIVYNYDLKWWSVSLFLSIFFPDDEGQDKTQSEFENKYP